MENNKTISKQTEKFTYKKGKTIAFLFITLFGVFFLSGMGLVTADFVGAGLLGGQLWFFWSVVTFLLVLMIVFEYIILHWIIEGIKASVIRSLYLYCWAILFVSSFVVGLQSATFGALNAQVVNFGFVSFGNLFSSFWVILMTLVTGVWIYTAVTNSHLDEHRYKVLRNYFFWMIAINLFIFHFEQASSGALGVDTEKMLLNTNLGDSIISNSTGWLSNAIGHQIFENKDFFVKFLKNHGHRGLSLILKGISDETIIIKSITPLINLEILSIITTLFGKGAFWGLNNSWSGWAIFLTVLAANIGISGYAYNRFTKNDVHNVDNPFFVLTPLIIIVFTIFMYSINAYIITFINDGHLNPGIVGSHIGHLQKDVPADASIIQIINAHWMRNILRYPVGDVFAGSYKGTTWWWIEWTVSLVGINVILFWSLIRHWKQLKADFFARKKSKTVKKS